MPPAAVAASPIGGARSSPRGSTGRHEAFTCRDGTGDPSRSNARAPPGTLARAPERRRDGRPDDGRLDRGGHLHEAAPRMPTSSGSTTAAASSGVSCSTKSAARVPGVTRLGAAPPVPAGRVRPGRRASCKSTVIRIEGSLDSIYDGPPVTLAGRNRIDVLDESLRSFCDTVQHLDPADDGVAES
jgi:hypothetical protein